MVLCSSKEKSKVHYSVWALATAVGKGVILPRTSVALIAN